MSEKIIEKKPVVTPFLIMWIVGLVLVVAAFVLVIIGLLLAVVGGVAVGIAGAASGGEASADTTELSNTINAYVYSGFACGFTGIPLFIVGLIIFIKKAADHRKWKKQHAPEKLVETH
jgi:hypothetical protein